MKYKETRLINNCYDSLRSLAMQSSWQDDLETTVALSITDTKKHRSNPLSTSSITIMTESKYLVLFWLVSLHTKTMPHPLIADFFFHQRSFFACSALATSHADQLALWVELPLTQEFRTLTYAKLLLPE